MKHAFVRAVICAALVLPVAAQAHKMWMVPSATVISGDDAWVTVDAAVSNDLYYPDHFPAQLDQLVITAPDGTTVKPENAATGRTRAAQMTARTNACFMGDSVYGLRSRLIWPSSSVPLVDKCVGAFTGQSNAMRCASRPPTSRAASTTSS